MTAITQRPAAAAEDGYAAHHEVRAANGLVWNVFYGALRLYFRLCGIRLQATNRVGVPDTPSIVLCNHGSFIDFIFAAALIQKHRPHFVIARLYFYNRILGHLLTLLGGFPKSMFTLDTESTRNCMRVLKNGEMLVMMPEARLSTTGRFEDIQGNTYSFIKKAGVPVYTITLHGNYLADPKWGRGFRRGAVVEAELDILYTADAIRTLTPAAIQQGVERRLDYDDFVWLKQRPRIRYRHPRIAEGLENVLAVCPRCYGKHTLYTKKHTVYCEHCGPLTAMDGRYTFTGDVPFTDLTQWYDWQMELLRQEIACDPDYALTAAVELRLPGNGWGLTRHGGYGTCTLTRGGLTYRGTKDGEAVDLFFPLSAVYRLLFGAGKNFETYNGKEILFFVPEDTRSAVDWYMASIILHDETVTHEEESLF